MGETRVDLLHLLEDLRDAYPGSVEETILTEIVANSLDSGASELSLIADPAGASFTAVDNGSGMQRRDLARFHDIAASTKVRGQGIGFAGVGIKLGLLVCDEALTETRRGKTHVASLWRMASRHRAPWKWRPPLGLVPKRGTAVRLRLRNPLSPLLDPGFLEEILRRHFRPLLDPAFDDFLRPHYPKGIRISINGSLLARPPGRAGLTAPLEIRLLRRRKPSALGYLTRADQPLPEEQRGLSISTFGKVIRHGWEWLGMTPAAPDRSSGLIEVPELAACLTLNKGDFIRTGPRGATYLSFRKAIQQAVSKQLGEWGDAPVASAGTPPREVRPLQRDLTHLLEDLAEDFPLLASLVEQRAGGQKRLVFGAKQYDEARELIAAAVAEEAERPEENAGTAPSGDATAPVGDTPVSREPSEQAPEKAGETVQIPGGNGRRRCALWPRDSVRRPRRGFESRAASRIDGLDQPRTPGISARAGIALDRLPYRARGRHVARAPGRGGRATEPVSTDLSHPLGRGGRKTGCPAQRWAALVMFETFNTPAGLGRAGISGRS